MKFLLPKIEIGFDVNETDTIQVMTNYVRVPMQVNYELFKSFSKVGDPMKLLVAGRFFYEVEMVDANSPESIRFMHFHSALDVVKDFEISQASSGWVLVIVLLVLAVVLVTGAATFYYYYKKAHQNKVVHHHSQLEMTPIINK